VEWIQLIQRTFWWTQLQTSRLFKSREIFRQAKHTKLCTAILMSWFLQTCYVRIPHWILAVEHTVLLSCKKINYQYLLQDKEVSTIPLTSFHWENIIVFIKKLDYREKVFFCLSHLPYVTFGNVPYLTTDEWWCYAIYQR